MASLSKNLDIMQQVARINRQLMGVVEKCQGPVEQTLFTQASLVAAEQRSLAPVDQESDHPGALKESVRVEVGEPTAKAAYVVKIKAGGALTQRTVAHGKSGRTYKQKDGGRGRGYVYDYARGIEFSTQEMPAEPFFFPIWRARRKEVSAAVRTAIKTAVSKVFS